MNILIIGDFSSLAINLKAGFKELGHRVVNVRTTDSFKNYTGGDDDIIYITNRRLGFGSIRIPKTHLLTAIFDNYKLRRKLQSCSVSFDLIIIVNEVFVSNSVFYAGISIDYIKKQQELGAKVLLMSCGGDTAYRLYGNLLKYNNVAFPEGRKVLGKSFVDNFNALIEIADAICPISYSYYATIKNYCNERRYNKKICCLSVPIVIGDYNFRSCLGRKIVLFHGKSRADKGSSFIQEACNNILKDFSDYVEILVSEPMSYIKYLEMFDKIDILIDQTNGYGIGMNAALGLMKGLVVLGGNEPEDSNCMNRESPVLNIIPDSNQIYGIIKDLILNPTKIDVIKKESRQFAEENLAAPVVAKKVLSILKIN